MFGKRNPARNVNATDTFIGEGTVVEGKITSAASLRIEGTVIGDIECAGDVTIGEKGFARSVINARHVMTAGRVEGSIRAKGKLTITRRGRVDGDIRAAALHVSEGGLLQGVCMMEAETEQLPKNAELRPGKEKHGTKEAKEARDARSASA